MSFVSIWLKIYKNHNKNLINMRKGKGLSKFQLLKVAPSLFHNRELIEMKPLT